METEATILIVDDDPQIRELGENILETAGFKVLLADSGEIGLAMARDNKPDVILLV